MLGYGISPVAKAEFLERLRLRADDISHELLEGRPITRIVSVSTQGADPHRHGRRVMCVETDAGSFMYKPHDCGLDALFLELVGRWYADCARAPKLVLGDGYAFVERLVPEGLADNGNLRTYWRNFGCLGALFCGLASRDMTQDNIMCCGTRPAPLDLETLLTGEIRLSAGTGEEDAPMSYLLRTAVLPMRVGGKLVSPLVADNTAGTCLPRVAGESRTVRGFERDFTEGFEAGYRHLMSHRDEVLAMLECHGDAVCRQILLNTWAYDRARTILLLPSVMLSPARKARVLAELKACYRPFTAELADAVAPFDVAALEEGDIPYYYARANSRTLFAGDGDAVGELLVKSPLELARTRLARLSEDDLQFELDTIHEYLTNGEALGDRP